MFHLVELSTYLAVGLGGTEEHEGGEGHSEGSAAHPTHEPQQLAEGGNRDGAVRRRAHEQRARPVDHRVRQVLLTSHELLQNLQSVYIT